MTTAGQDGERITDEMVKRAVIAARRAPRNVKIAAALAAVVPDVEARVRREHAAEVRALVRERGFLPVGGSSTYVAATSAISYRDALHTLVGALLLLEKVAAETRETCADEVTDALGDWDRLPADVRDRVAVLLHRWRTGRGY